MNSKEIPLKLIGVRDSIYAGFWLRLGALLLDMLIMMPVYLVIIYLNNQESYFLFIGMLIGGPIQIFYRVYLVQRYGGTPGKLLVGTKVLKLDASDVTWREAFVRESVQLGLMLFSYFIAIVALSRADIAQYESLGWLEKGQYLMALAPALYSIHFWANNIWVWGEIIVLLFNDRKRAPHDYMAGTVVVKADYIPQIRQTMALSNDTQSDSQHPNS